MEAAIHAGLRVEDLLFDPLVMTVGADDQAAKVALECIRLLRVEFAANNITGGASNVSFGMPDRPGLNASFLTTACAAGMNIPITDPTNTLLRGALSVADLFLGRDRRLRRYMQLFRQVAAGESSG
jgi:5-methyltetrahydrofolate--homocysteine methyltransferase